MTELMSPLCADKVFEGNRGEAVLLIHGYTGSPANMLPVARIINAAGYTVCVPRLRGHGTSIEDMQKATWRDWTGDLEAYARELKKQYSHLYIAGLSMGGALTLYLASLGLADKAVTMAAAIKLRHGRSAPFSKVLWPFVPVIGGDGPRRPRENFLNDYDIGYVGNPTRKVGDLLHVIKLAIASLADIKCPILIFSPQLDRTVDPMSANIIYDGVSSAQKEIVPLQRSTHVCTLDVQYEEMADRILEFLSGHD